MPHVLQQTQTETAAGLKTLLIAATRTQSSHLRKKTLFHFVLPFLLLMSCFMCCGVGAYLILECLGTAIG